MLPKPYRLPSRELRRVRKDGKRIVIHQLEFCYVLTRGTSSRLTVIVPKRLDKRAAVRNRQRRIILESLSSLLPKIPRAIDGVITVRQLFQYPQERIKLLLKQVLESTL